MDEEGRRRFGLRLRGLRDARWATQQQAAETIGVSLDVYKNLELGRKDISTERMLQIAAALDVPLDDLLAPPGTPFWRRVRKGIRESGVAGPLLSAEMAHECLCCWYKFHWLVIG